jgi:hypothetical protein
LVFPEISGAASIVGRRAVAGYGPARRAAG